jgi:hypothetical protein
MNTTHMTQVRAGVGASLAALCFGLTACGTEHGARPTGESHPNQQAAADDVAAQVDLRKTALSQEQAHRQHSVADDVERLVELRKSAHGAR